MPITFACPNPDCGKRYTVPDDAAGRRTTCTACGMKMQVPAAAKGPPPDDEFEERPPLRRRSERDRDDFDDDLGDAPRPLARARGDKPSRGGFMDFVLFKFLIAPRILILLYWVLVVLIILGGLGFMVISFFSGDFVRILIGIFGGLLIMIIYPVL